MSQSNTGGRRDPRPNTMGLTQAGFGELGFMLPCSCLSQGDEPAEPLTVARAALRGQIHYLLFQVPAALDSHSFSPRTPTAFILQDPPQSLWSCHPFSDYSPFLQLSVYSEEHGHLEYDLVTFCISNHCSIKTSREDGCIHPRTLVRYDKGKWYLSSLPTPCYLHCAGS